MEQIPSEYRDLVAGGVYGTVSTLDADGSPHATPVWIDYDDGAGEFMLNTVEGRRKERNLRRDPRIALSLMHPADPREYLSVQGKAVGFETEGAIEHFDAMAESILGEEDFFASNYDDPDAVVRVIVRIRPDSVYWR